MDDGEPMTFRGALRAPEFWLMLVTAFAGVFGVAWWVAVPLATLGLSISSLPKYFAMLPRVRAAGVESEWLKTVALSVFNNIGGACAGFFIGMLSRWVWF